VTHPSHPTPDAVLAERAELEREVAGRTLCSEFLRTVAARGPAPALRAPDRDLVWTWDDYAAAVARVAGGLRRLGLRPGEPVAVLSRNRPEFHAIDIGTLFAGGVPFSLYNSATGDQLAYVLGHSRAAVVVAEDAAFADRVRAVADRLPDLRHVIVIEDASWAGLTGGEPADLAALAAAADPEAPATVIYTSGTTGTPKGVVLTHHNVCYAMNVHFRVMGIPMAGLRQLSYLPMAHIGERQVTHYYHVLGGTDVTCCADLTRLAPLMAEVRPQWWFCAPRLWEKLRAGIEAELQADPDRRARFDAALRTGARVHELRRSGAAPPADLAAEWDRVRAAEVAPVLARRGLADIVMAITGAAPLAPETLRFFLACGVTVSDVYGSSETSGFMSWSPHHVVPGNSGRPLPGLEMRLAADGEIEVRAPSVFGGYLRDPERTAEAFTPDGYYRTGDLGRWDADGNLTVIDRKKEVLVPSSGHKVSPVLLENAVKRECPLIGQACAVGDARPHVVMLMVLDPDLAGAWARDRGLPADLTALAGHPGLRAEVAAAVARVNAGLPRAEQVRAHRVLGDPWLPDTDLLTPTAKLKRRGVLARYAGEIDALYAPVAAG
jgi:long-chain acyl-CoA synthetase